jgi:hypothetical protein
VELFKLKSSKFISVKIISVIIVVMTFAFLMTSGLQGCKSNNVITEETSAETSSETSSVSTQETPQQTAESTAEAEIITDNINMLSGLELSDKVQDYRPIAIMVQNNPKARPHSGLIYADIVFEMVAEGGVTRFVTLFSSHDADIIGPVRSARIYFAEVARSLDPIYTFWGTYPQAYEAIKKMDMDVLDANSTNYVNYTSAGWRDPSRNEALEHTAFIDTFGIKKDAEKFGYSLEGGQSPMAFKIDATEAERGTIADIEVNFSSESYLAGFTYDKNTNKYLKSVAGEPHSDYETGEQISLNNVIVLITDIGGPIDSAGHMTLRTTGTHDNGEAYYFMDGNVIEGTWGRKSISDPFEFKDAGGNQILFNRGSTWVCIIGSMERLSY